MRDIKEGSAIIEELTEKIKKGIFWNGVADYSKIAEYLIDCNYRKIDVPGLIVCKGEVYIVSPEIEDKVLKVLN